jgi:hypothetical protein
MVLAAAMAAASPVLRLSRRRQQQRQQLKGLCRSSKWQQQLPHQTASRVLCRQPSVQVQAATLRALAWRPSALLQQQPLTVVPRQTGQTPPPPQSRQRRQQQSLASSWLQQQQQLVPSTSLAPAQLRRRHPVRGRAMVPHPRRRCRPLLRRLSCGRRLSARWGRRLRE